MRLISFGLRVPKLGVKLTFPDRFKGTMIEKWSMYWKNLFIDYRDVTISLMKDSRENPKRASIYLVSGYSLYQCVKYNPNEEDFHKQFRCASNNLIMVHPSLQNPKSTAFVRRLQRDINENRLRFLSLGIITILWEDLYDKDDCTYLTQSEYAKVDYRNFHEHIVDIGFLNQYWRLKYEMYNFDVNYL